MIDRDEAIEIARARAAHNGWGFGQPLQVIHRRPWFRREAVASSSRQTPTRFVVDEETGAILDEGYIPR
jgi:hypothetical protein